MIKRALSKVHGMYFSSIRLAKSLRDENDIPNVSLKLLHLSIQGGFISTLSARFKNME